MSTSEFLNQTRVADILCCPLILLSVENVNLKERGSWRYFHLRQCPYGLIAMKTYIYLQVNK